MSFVSIIERALGGDLLASENDRTQQIGVALRQLKGKDFKTWVQGIQCLVDRKLIQPEDQKVFLRKVVTVQQAVNHIPSGILTLFKDPMEEMRNIESLIEAKQYAYAFSRLAQMNRFKGVYSNLIDITKMVGLKYIRFSFNNEVTFENLPEEAHPFICYFYWIGREGKYVEKYAQEVISKRNCLPVIFELLSTNSTPKKYPLLRYLLALPAGCPEMLREKAKTEAEVFYSEKAQNEGLDFEDLSYLHAFHLLSREALRPCVNNVCVQEGALSRLEESFPSFNAEFRNFIISAFLDAIELGRIDITKIYSGWETTAELRKECLTRNKSLTQEEETLPLDTVRRIYNRLKFGVAFDALSSNPILYNFERSLMNNLLSREALQSNRVLLDEIEGDTVHCAPSLRATAAICKIFANLSDNMDANMIEKIEAKFRLIPNQSQIKIIDRLYLLSHAADNLFLKSYIRLLFQKYNLDLEIPPDPNISPRYEEYLKLAMFGANVSHLRKDLFEILALDGFTAHITFKSKVMKEYLKANRYLPGIPLNETTDATVFEICFQQSRFAESEWEIRWLAQIPKGHSRYGQVLVRQVEILHFKYSKKYAPAVAWEKLQPWIMKVHKFQNQFDLGKAKLAHLTEEDTQKALDKFDIFLNEQKAKKK